MTTPRDPCHRCRIRWVQAWLGPYAGLCRRCAMEAGAVLPTAREFEAERVARREQAIASKRAPDSGPRPPIEKVINGVAYEVNWDGT